jgi:outer membrane protein assembly factor BamB
MRTTLLFFASSLIAFGAADRNWPAWRGPLANGTAPKANPPTVWSEAQNVRWKVKLPGSGTSTPIIWNDLIFIQTAIPTGKKVTTTAAEPRPQVAGQVAQPDQGQPGERRRRPGGGGGGGMRSEKPNEHYQFTLLAIDRATGKTRWQKVAAEELPHEGHHRDHGFASHSPVTDGEGVIAYFGSRGLHCFDLKGNLLWKKDLGDMQTKMGFGEGSSPVLYGNMVIINWDHEGDDFIAAFDKKTGNELWRTPRNEDTTWSTPLVVQAKGKPQVVTCATEKVRSYDLATGKLIWECAKLTANVIPSPVAAGDMVYATSGFKGNALLAIRLGREGDLTGTDAIAWSYNRSTPYVPSPLLTGDKLVFFAGNNATLSILDAKSGKVHVDAERIEVLQGVYASPVAATGRIYLVGRNGAAAVIADDTKLNVLAQNKLDDAFDASPALAGNDLILRGRQNLYCLAEK